MDTGATKEIPNLGVTREQIAAFCRRHHIRRLAFFGSVLRSDFNAGSDVDVLYEFDEGVVIGWDIVDVIDDLSRLFGGRKIDFVSYASISPRLRAVILGEAQELYAAA